MHIATGIQACFLHNPYMSLFNSKNYHLLVYSVTKFHYTGMDWRHGDLIGNYVRMTNSDILCEMYNLPLITLYNVA